MRSMIFLAFFLSTPTFACTTDTMSSKHQAAVLEAIDNLKELLTVKGPLNVHSLQSDVQSAILEACQFWK